MIVYFFNYRLAIGQYGSRFNYLIWGKICKNSLSLPNKREIIRRVMMHSYIWHGFNSYQQPQDIAVQLVGDS